MFPAKSKSVVFKQYTDQVLKEVGIDTEKIILVLIPRPLVAG